MDDLRIRMFGGLSLEAGGEQLPPIASRTGRSLLAYLIAHRATAPARDLLAGMFWPDMTETLARRRLSHALWQIQSVLGEAEGLDTYVIASPTTIRFNTDARVWVDVDEFDSIVALLKASGPADLDRRPETLDRLIHAVRLYTGDFLAGYYDDWIMVEQERLRQNLSSVLNHIVRLSKSWGDFDQALLYARRLALLDPLHEEAHREVMRLCYLVGRPNDALAQYDRCASILASEMGAEPAADTTALRDEIALGRHAPIVPLSDGSRSRLFEADGAPLVGRARQRQDIIAGMEDALAGSGGIVLVEGDGGSGKTRLLTESAEDANWRGLSVLWGGSATAGVTRPFEGLRQALEDGLTELRVHQLRERMESVWLAVLAPLLPALQRWAPDIEPLPKLRDGSEERDRMREAFHRMFIALAGLTPTMLVLDDLHRLDDDTLWALETLAVDVVDTPLLICLAYRRTPLEKRREEWQVVRRLDRTGRRTRVILEPLSVTEIGELVRRILPESSTSALVTRLHQHTGGNPLFILETLRAMHERQVSDALRPPTEIESIDQDLPVSDTVFDLISRRLGTLSPEARHAVWALAVAGSAMDIDGLAEVCKMPRPAVLDAIDSLIQAGMVGTRRGRYALSHDQLGRVAYESIDPAERPELHARLAWYLEETGDEDPATLGHHFRLGRVPARATHYLAEAGSHAARLSAFASARDRYSEAIEQGRQAGVDAATMADLQLALERVLDVLADRDGQRRLLDELTSARGLADGLRSEVMRRRARLLAALSQLEVAGDLATSALEIDEARGDDTGQAEDLLVLGTISLWRSQHRRAEAHLRAALELAEAGGDLAADIGHVLGDVLIDKQAFGDADRFLTTAQTIYERTANKRGLAGVARSQAVLHGETGAYELVRPALDRADRICVEIGYQHGVALNALNLGFFYRITGQAARALEPTRRSLHIFESMANLRGRALALANLADLLLYFGDSDGAHDLASEALTVFEMLDNRLGAALCRGTLASVERRRGQRDAAIGHVAAGLQLAAGDGGTNARFQLQRTRAHLHLDDGELGDGLALAEAAWQAAERANKKWLQIDLTVPFARALVMVGRPEDALELTGVIEPSPHEAELLYWRMEAQRHLGDHEGAYETLETAHVAVQRQFDGLRPDEVTRSLTAVPVNRQLEAAWRAGRPDTQVIQLARLDTPTGRPIAVDDLVDVAWTVRHPLDGLLPEGPDRRRHRLLRLVAEAEAAGAAPTVADIAAALDVSTATARRDIDALRSRGHGISTRGRRR
ncbi:MAG: AAA family ATPase [Acidimicrobiia bacterium]|nr:AAA family ATPase [Acidimicrobiia bacterium]NNL69759.1 AAA family ATPase [Acidimicrobiia bacterium]